MKIIYNSFMGGLFRTLGKFIAFIVLFLVFGYIVSSNDLKIADLIGFGSVKAWSDLDYREARAGINQRICNSSHTSCTASSSVTLYSLNTYLSYLPCTNFQCPNNERNSDFVGVFRVSASFNDNHSFDSGVMYRLWFTFQLQGLNTNQVVLNNLESINSSIFLVNHSYNTLNNATGMFTDGSTPQIYFERISASGYVRLAIVFKPNASGYHYVDTTFGLKNPDNVLSWSTMPQFKGFNSIRASTASIAYTRNSDEQAVQTNIQNNQNWIDVNYHIGQVENSVNEVNDSVNDVNDSIKGIDDYMRDDSIDNNHISAGMHDLPQTTSLTPFADFLNLPLNWIQDFMDTSNSCHNLVIPLPFVNQNLTLPCMSSFWNKLGALASLIDLVWIAVIGSRIFRMFYRLTIDVIDLDPNSFNHLSKLKEWEL